MGTQEEGVGKMIALVEALVVMVVGKDLLAEGEVQLGVEEG